MKSFLKTKKLLNERQSGFKERNSTTDALISIIKEICSARDKKNYVCVLILDLKKAFDLVLHKILFFKLRKMGFRRIINLLKWYLTERKQHIKSGQKRSAIKSLFIVSEIQERVVGLHLSHIFINVIFNLFIEGAMTLFADNITIVFSDKDINELNTKFNNAMNELFKYFR
jgi:hypothetical protein